MEHHFKSKFSDCDTMEKLKEQFNVMVGDVSLGEILLTELLNDTDLNEDDDDLGDQIFELYLDQ